MNWLRLVRFRFRTTFRKGKLDAEMAEEMRDHLALRIERNLAAGMSTEEARLAAQRSFGGLEQIKERCRDERGWLWLDALRRDVGFSIRSLRRSPAFSLTVIITLALCIGVNSAILSALYSLVLKRLPFHEPEQLVEIYNTLPKAGVMKVPMSVVQYLDYQANADLFEGFALWANWSFTLNDESAPTRANGARVTPDYFGLLGVQPLLGRFYSMEESMPGHDHVVVLTQTYWETRYRGEPAVVGTEIRLNGQPHTIIGVAPRRLEALNNGAVLLKPFTWSPAQAHSLARHGWSATMFARVKSGVNLRAAGAQLAMLEERHFEHVAPPEEVLGLRDQAGLRIALGRVRAEQSKAVTDGLFLLQAGALAVLLLGVLNVATLMLVRVGARQAEFAIRHALGAGGRALILQLWVESMLLVTMGGAIGVALAWSSVEVFKAYQAEIIPEVPPVALDGTVLGVSIIGSFAIAWLICLTPVVRIGRLNAQNALQNRMASALASRGMRIASGTFVIAQVALAFILLVGACLLIRSYARVIAVDAGFEANRFIHARVALSPAYKGETAQSVKDRIIAAMREIPGVEAASLIPGDPMKGEFAPSAFPIPGSSNLGAVNVPTAWLLNVGPDLFQTMGIRIVEGRGFTPSEAEGSHPVAIVDRNFAERHFPGRSAVGERLGHSPNLRVIVGVAEAVKFGRLDDHAPRPFVYWASPYTAQVFSIIVRTERSVSQVVPMMREALRRIDPTLPLYDVQRLDLALDNLLDRRRGIMGLLGAFALLAVLLSAIGIYGVLAYDVSRRTREIGIRGAVGASRPQIVMLIVGQGIRRTVAGLAIGLVAAWMLTRFLSSQLFEVEPGDPLTFGAAFLLLLATAATASWLPARQAAKIDPMVALRVE